MLQPMKIVKRLHPKQLVKTIRTLGSDLHRDNSGSISIATVFSFLFLTMLLGMVINIGRHVDRKVKIQNAADASTYTGASVMARSMNTLTFTNFLLCDVFALTAYLREARDRNAEATCQPILDKWDDVAPDFSQAPLLKFGRLYRGVPVKTNLERRLIYAWGEYNAAISERLLPVMEEVLQQEMIPEFQRALAAHAPNLANIAANEIAGRHGPTGRGLAAATEMNALMWRTDGAEFGAPTPDGLYAMPVADPVNDWSDFQTEYFDEAVEMRARFANNFLNTLNNQLLMPLEASLQRPRDDKFVPPEKYFGTYGYQNGAAKLSQFSHLWRGFSRAYLRQLLEDEYPFSNLPFQMRKDPQQNLDTNRYLEKDFMFIGVAYWKQMPERMPGLFRNPAPADQLAYGQAQLFCRKGRFFQRVRYIGDPRREFGYSGGLQNRDLWNQTWAAQMVPATAAVIPTVLQQVPSGSEVDAPYFGGLNVEEFRRISTH